jgi:hypothetical protein
MSQNQIAVGIIVEDDFEGLQETLRSAGLLSDLVFVLSAESVAEITEQPKLPTQPNVIYHK